MLHIFTSRIRSALIILQVSLLILGGNLLLITTSVKAAGEEQRGAHNCYVPGINADGSTETEPDYIDDVRDDSSLSSGRAAASFDLDIAMQDPIFANTFNQEKFDQYVKLNQGWYDSTDKMWYFCSLNSVSDLMSLVPFSPTERNVIDALDEDSLGKIAFKNPTDYYALTGETCRQFNGNVCDQTKLLVDKDNNPILDSNGKQQTVVETCPNGNATYGTVYNEPDADGTRTVKHKYSPVFFDDDVWLNGCWDAPKADVRILKTLTYLVTPTEYGGAGREYIKVGKILQETTDDGREFPPEETESTDDEEEETVSSHAYDKSNPGNPELIAQALDITEIDKLRVTTEIIKRTRVGSRKSYKYQSFPVKVAWQTDEGITKSGGLPSVNIQSSAEDSINLSILDMLEEFGFNEEDEDIDLENVSLDNLGSIAEFLGEHLVNQLMGGTGGKLDAKDLDDTLENLGRAYLAKELGLPAGSLSQGNTPEEVTENIGRITVEKSFGFARDSLKGKDQDEIFTNIGRRFLESDVFNVSQNTLASPIPKDQAEMLTRLGEGTIERRFRLSPQLLRGKSFDDVKGSSVKTQVIFSTKEYQYVDEALGLAYISAEGQNPFASFGFTEQDFANPTKDLLTASNKDQAWEKYKRLVGLRAYQSGIGVFTTNQTAERFANSDSNFIPYVLRAFGVNTNSAASARTSASNPGDMITTIKNSSLYKDMISLTVKDRYGAETKPFSESSLLPILSDLVTVYVAGTYDIGSLSDHDRDAFNARLVQIHNEINRSNPPGWRLRFQGLVSSVEPYLDSQETDQANKESLKGISDKLNGFLSKIEQFYEAILSLEDQDQQSGANAALNLPTNVWSIDDNGEQHVGSYASTTDVMSAIMSGNFGVLPLLGKLHAVTLITPDKAAQHNLAEELLSDSTLSIFNDLAGIGITDATLLDKGISTSEFRQIFKDGLGRVVFQKIGRQVLLKVLWESTSDSSAAKKAAEQVHDVVETYDFYKSRIDRLGDINNEIIRLVNDYLNNHKDGTGDDIRAVQDLLNTLKEIRFDKASIRTIIDSAERLGTALDRYQAIIDRDKEPGNKVVPLINEAIELIQEIFAGKNLSYNGAVSGGNKDNRECISSVTLRAFLREGLNFKNIVIEISSCRIDSSLGLPSGSIYGWFSGSDHGIRGLESAVGYADARSRKRTVTPEEARNKGHEILRARLIMALGNTIPGFQQFADRYNINPDDLALLLNGHADDFIRKVGSSMLDSYMKWPAGTTDSLVSPVCLDTQGKERECSKNENTNLRFRVMAQLGLTELGLSLNFPSTFDITQGGNFITNYGKASVSEYLGLRTNTFAGSFAGTLSANTNQIILTGLRADNFPLLNKVIELQGRLRNIRTDNELGKNLLIRDTQAYIDAYREDIAKELQSTSSPFWLIPSEETAGIQLNSQVKKYYELLNSMRYYAQAAFAARGDTSFSNAISTYLDEYTSNVDNESYWAQTYGKEQLKGYLDFRARLQDLNAHFNLSQTKAKGNGDPNPNGPDDWGMFEKWILGIVQAEEISGLVGNHEIRIHLADEYINSHLSEDNPIRILLDTFKVLTKSSSCNSGITVGQLLFGNSSTSCPFTGIGDLGFDTIFSDNADDLTVQKRAYLFDTFLTGIFSNSLEDRLGFQKGVFRAIIIQPSMAKDILTEQGVLIIGEQLFGINPSDNDDTRVLKSALYDAYLAGFYDPATKTYSLNFNKERSLEKLKERSYAVIRHFFEPYNHEYFGNNISTSDIQMIFSGDMNAFMYFGVMSQVYQINKQLVSEGSSNAHARDFLIDYNTVRASASYLSDQELNRRVASDIRKEYCKNKTEANKAVCDIRDDKQFLSEYAQKEYAYSNVDERKAMAQESFANQKKKAQEALMFGIMDAMAFKADPSIPKGFSRAMLRGTNTDRMRSLGAYAISKLGIDKPFAEVGITPEMLVQIIEYGGCLLIHSGNTSTCQIPPDQYDATYAAITKLDQWFSRNFEKMFGISLPNEYSGGLITGLFAWGQAGFTYDAFFDDQLNFMGKKVPGMGAVVTNVFQERIFKWVDRQLGMSPGSAYAIYEGYTKYRAAYEAYQAAMRGVAVYDDLGEFIMNKVDPAKVADAKAAMKEAQAAVIALAINLVFSSEISDAEQSLGLVPGTGGMAVGMLVNLIMNVPISPWTIAAFVLMNVFGVYKVDINVQATGDGYYPIRHKKNEARYYPQDLRLGTFNAKDPASYRAGSMLVAQNKVKGLLTDLLLMPDGNGDDTYGWGATTGDAPEDLWINQIFTNRPQDIADLEYLIGRNAPWDNPVGWGYGDLYDRVEGFVLNDPNNPSRGIATPKDGYYAGVFSGAEFWGHIHIRW